VADDIPNGAFETTVRRPPREAAWAAKSNSSNDSSRTSMSGNASRRCAQLCKACTVLDVLVHLSIF